MTTRKWRQAIYFDDLFFWLVTVCDVWDVYAVCGIGKNGSTLVHWMEMPTYLGRLYKREQGEGGKKQW